jgi:predicted metal-binding protein
MKINNFEKEISVDQYLNRFVNYDYSLEKCSECPNFGNVWSCPPFDFKPIDKIKEYANIRFFLYMVEAEAGEDLFKVYRDETAVLNSEILEKEKEISGSLAFIAGSCRYCGKDGCARKHGKPCIHTDKCRHSIEATGGRVDKIAEDLFGVEIKWSKDGSSPPYLILMQALLYKE